MYLIKYALITIISIMFIGCGISKENKELSVKIEQNIKDMKKNIKAKEIAFNKDHSNGEFKSYIVSENLNTYFANSNKTILFAESEFSKKIKPLIEKDDSDDEQQLLNYFGSINTLLRQASSNAQYPETRIALFKDILKNKDKFKKTSEVNKKDSEEIFKKFSLLALKAKTEYPEKQKDIDTRIALINNLNESSKNNFEILIAEFDNKDINLTRFSQSNDIIAKSNINIKAESEKQTNKINELFHSYSKIISDMKEVYFVTVGRVSWDESSDWDNENTYIYPAREVSLKTFEYFDSVSEQEMGSLGGGLFSSTSSDQISTNWDRSKVDSLNINARESLPSGDDSANFWIENMYVDTYHKYTIIEDGKSKETDWVKVDEAFFESNINNLGMEILSKPYGFYEDEKIVTAAPAGMSYVGNKHYGSWKTDSSGNSFWHYYGMYSFMNNMIGGNNYSRNDWTSYGDNRRNNQGYYGKDNSYGTYGSKTYKSGSRYAKSDYVRKNRDDIMSYKHSKTKSGSRDFGHKARGRGPGGGGK